MNAIVEHAIDQQLSVSEVKIGTSMKRSGKQARPAPVPYAPNYVRPSKLTRAFKFISKAVSLTGLVVMAYTAIVIGLFIHSAIIEF